MPSLCAGNGYIRMINRDVPVWFARHDTSARSKDTVDFGKYLWYVADIL